jgi:hypothetical protein
VSKGLNNRPSIKVNNIKVGQVSELSPETVTYPLIDRTSHNTAISQSVTRNINIL